MTMTEPGFPVQTISGVPVVTAPEEIDITNADQLRAALLHAAARPAADLVVDMTRTQFCDCAGLHALVGAHKRARAEGRQVRLAVTSPQVRRILALTALDRLIPVYASLDHALARPAAVTGGRGPRRRVSQARNVPSQRTVTSWSAKPASMWSPRRRSTSFWSSSSRKNTRPRSARDGGPVYRPYAAASSSVRNSTGMHRTVGANQAVLTRSDQTVTRSSVGCLPTSERRRAVTRPDSARYRPWPFHCGRTPYAGRPEYARKRDREDGRVRGR